MQRLWDEEAAGGSETLRVETLERLGGADRIVEEHLTGALAGLSESDRDAASRIFQQLVTPTGTKIAHEAGDLAGYAGLPRDATDRLLHELSDQRILRPLGRGDAKDERYEIFHDVLAPATLAWRAQHEAEQRLARERESARRRHRRLAALAGSALAALAVLAVVAAYALSQRSDAEANAREARARALESQALALRATDPEQSLRLALAAAESVPGDESERVLRASLLAARTQTVIQTDGPLVAAGEANGELIAEQADGTSLRVDAAAGRATELAAGAGRTRAAQVGAAGAIVTATDGTVAVDGRPIDGVAAADGAALAGDGQRAAILRGSDAVIVSVPGGRPLRTLEHPVPVSAVAFVAADTIATGDVDGVIRLWDAGDAPPRLLRGHATGTRIFSLAASADGSLLASGGADGTARVWEVASGDLVAVLSAHDNFVDAVAFSPDAKHLATGSTDHTARIWRIGRQPPADRARRPPRRGAIRGLHLGRRAADGLERWHPAALGCDPGAGAAGRRRTHRPPCTAPLAGRGSRWERRHHRRARGRRGRPRRHALPAPGTRRRRHVCRVLARWALDRHGERRPHGAHLGREDAVDSSSRSAATSGASATRASAPTAAGWSPPGRRRSASGTPRQVSS